MNAIHRLHTLRMENDAAGFAMDELRPRFDRMANRHENGTAPRAVAAYQLFQTPPELAVRMVASINVRSGQRVLEPSAGLGRLLDALPQGCDAVAIEMASQCAGELFRQERAGVRILQRDFLTVQPAELGLFDAVTMNPPFRRGADVLHIMHARDFLRNNGRLAALCLDTSQRETVLRPLAATWEKIEAGTFGKEGTRVPTVLLTMTA